MPEETMEYEYVTLADPSRGRSAGYLFSTAANPPFLPTNCPNNTLALDLRTKKMYYFVADDEGYYTWSLVGGNEVYQEGTIGDDSGESDDSGSTGGK